MKSKNMKKLMSVLLAATTTTSMVLAKVVPAYAADSKPMQGEQARKSNQPKFPGYRIWDIRDWSPETDPYAEFMRSHIPLQNRNEAFKPTQANPNLDTQAQIMLMQGDYNNAFVDGMMYNNTFGYHVLNFWQYVDYFSPWHGAATAYVPENLYDWQNELTDPNGWQKRFFEFGILNIPNPSYTNAAHKNGVKSIACIYFDQAFRAGQTINELFIKDENGKFTVAEKLIEMAKYFGYDGYFFNCEEAPKDREIQKQFLARLTEAGLWTQFYDTNSSMNDSKAQWLKSTIGGEEKRIQNSVFVNYNWSYYLDASLKYAANKGIDPFKEVFFGVEANQNRFHGGHISGKNLTALYAPGTKNPRGSIALFTPSDFYQRGIGENFQEADYQWQVTERERMYFSGVLSNPKNTGLKPGTSRPEVNVSNSGGWVGVADFTSERSVINGSKFYSNFNTGHGMQYFTKGNVSADSEWSNINIQDILPTWQWWIDVPQKPNPDNPNEIINAGEKLKVDFDYGEKYHTEAYNYKKIGGYNGGSSLVVAGKLEVENFLRLFKTDLDVKATTKVSITYNKPSETDGTEMRLGIILKDNPNKIEYIPIPVSGNKTSGWVTTELDLSTYTGRKIATLGLAFNGTQGAVPEYQMNIGEIKVTDGGNYTPETPKGFRIDRVFTEDEMIVKWDIADYNIVDRYEIYANLSDGKKVYVGGTYDDILYIKSLLKEKDIVTLELVAVGKDGSKSTPAAIKFDYKDKVSNIKVTEQTSKTGIIKQADELGVLNLSWENPRTEYKALEIQAVMLNSTDKEVFTKTVAKGISSTKITVPRGHGERYQVSIVTVLNDGTKTEAMRVTGKMKDVYSGSYDPKKVTINGTRAVFWCPDPVDWWKMHVTFNGQVVKFGSRFAGTTNEATRGKNYMTATLPSDSGVMEIVLEDYVGNFSKPTIIPLPSYTNSEAEITSEIIPDPVLFEAIKTQAGKTMRAAAEFNGLVDLSGLDIKNFKGVNLLQNVKELKLCETSITEISKNTFSGNIEKLDLSNCIALSAIQPSAFSYLPNLKELNITGCSNLEIANFNNSSLEKLVYGDAKNFNKLTSLDMSNAKFDMSKVTPERTFADEIAKQTVVKFDNQRPVLYKNELPKNIKIEVAEGTLGVAVLQKAATIRGTDPSNLKNTDFIAPDYDINAQLANDDVMIKLTDTNRNITTNTIDTSKANTYKAEFISFNTPNSSGKVIATTTINVGGDAEEPEDPQAPSKVILKETIAAAKAKYDVAIVGTGSGQYPKTAKNALLIAVKVSETIYNNSASTETNVAAAIKALNKAIETFEASKIP